MCAGALVGVSCITPVVVIIIVIIVIIVTTTTVTTSDFRCRIVVIVVIPVPVTSIAITAVLRQQPMLIRFLHCLLFQILCSRRHLRFSLIGSFWA
jgi:hypothetical protein